MTDNRFWQALALEDGALVAEVVSNTYLRGEEVWSSTQEAALRHLGWSPPDGGRRPNWLWIDEARDPDIDDTVARASATRRGVFGRGETDPLVVTTFLSSRHGGTPASPGERQGPKGTVVRRHHPSRVTASPRWLPLGWYGKTLSPLRLPKGTN